MSIKGLALSLLPAALALPGNPLYHGGGGHHPENYSGWNGDGRIHSTAYFLDNDPSGSSLVALKIGADGKLSDPVRTSTGGIGAIEVNATDGTPFQTDSLGSQGAVVVSEDMLFTVNAGSDTVVMFRIDPENAMHPRMVGKPVSSQGQFPTSVTYSPALQMLCVLNGGAKAGVACFNVDSAKGLQAQDSLRGLGDTIHESTPPNGPPGSAGQIIFDPMSKGVFAMIKGNAGAKPAELGAIVAFNASHDGVSSIPVISQFDNVFMDFSGLWLSDTRLFMTDPSFGIAYLDLQDNLKFTQAVHTTVATQKALCWNVYDASTGTGYAIDAGQNVLYKIDGKTGALKGNITIATDEIAKDGGIFDSALAVQSGLLYSLTGGNGIAVTDITSGEKVQYLDLSSFGDRQGYQGMALF